MSSEDDGSSEKMEIDEGKDYDEEEEENFVSALLKVDKKDLQNLSIQYDENEDEETDRVVIKRESGSAPFNFLSPRKPAQKRKLSTSESEHELEELRPYTSAGTSSEMLQEDPEDQIRRATNQYLRGEIQLSDFEALMDIFERYKQQYESEEHNTSHQPSLIYLNPDNPEADVKPHIPEVILKEEDEESGANNLAKLRGEFFRTGDNTATFSVRRKRKMPPTIKNMMGEAHVRFARGDLQGSENICFEIIKEQPTYKDPFHTLAMIYENQGKLKKSLQFSIISGLLDPKKFDDWPRVAELSVKEGKIPQAIWCLTKALSRDSGNTKMHMRRSQLMFDTGDYKGALRGFTKVLSFAENDGTIYMDVAKSIAAIHFKNNELDQAYEALCSAVNKFPEKVTTAELNLLVEVCISLKRYVKAVTLFVRFSGIRFEPSVPKASFRDRNSLMTSLSEIKRKCVIPVGLHADLVQKLTIVLIHLEAFEMVLPLVNTLKETESLDAFGLQLYEIAEAYLAKQQYGSSVTILETLVNTEKYKMAEIWLRYAECLFLLNRLEESSEAYTKVIQLAPGHKIARLNRSVILQKLGKFDIALESLGQNDMEDLIDQDLLVEKCNILLSRNRIPEFYQTALQLFNRHCPIIRSHDEAHALVITSQTNQMLGGLRALRIRKGETTGDDIPPGNEKNIDNPIGEWTVYLSLLKMLLKINRVDLLCRVVYTVWSSPVFGADSRMKQDMDLQCVLASILNADVDMTPLHIRGLIITYGLSSIILSLMSLACRRCGHTRYGRQIVRLLMKRPNDTRLMMMSAHNSFMNGTYKYALMEYLALYKHRPKDPIVPIMIASTFIHIASQKHTTNRSQLMIQAIGFMNKYAELRGECQEMYYNMGRFYHYLRMFQKAMEYYKKVLSTDPVHDDSIPDYNLSDLKREAAFNIAQIYKSHNCWQMAKQYIHRYVVI